MNALVVASQQIRMDTMGRFSLNDLHKAAGGASKHRPSVWLANQQVQDLVREIEAEAGIPALTKVRGGAHAGTFVAEQLVIAYAAWISPRFNLQVVNTFLAVQRAARAEVTPVPLDDPAALRRLLLRHAEQELALQNRVEQQAPQVAALQRLADARGAMSVTAAAKALNLPPTALFSWMQQHGWLYRSSDHGGWLAFQKRIDRGQMRHRSVTVERSDGTPRLVDQPLVTPKGLARLAELLEREAVLETTS